MTKIFAVLLTGPVLSSCGSHAKSARSFLTQRGMAPPSTATNFYFEQRDTFRSLEHRVAFDVPSTDQRHFRAQLWCEPAAPYPYQKVETDGPFGTRELSDIEFCDTNGPFDGRYHLDVKCGFSSAGHVRFLLTFSD